MAQLVKNPPALSEGIIEGKFKKKFAKIIKKKMKYILYKYMYFHSVAEKIDSSQP